MGIFSLFGKKETQPEKTKAAKSSTPARPSGADTIANMNEDELFTQSVETQKHVARATALKIDDIEREMTRDLVPKAPVPGKAKSAAPMAPKAEANATPLVARTVPPIAAPKTPTKAAVKPIAEPVNAAALAPAKPGEANTLSSTTGGDFGHTDTMVYSADALAASAEIASVPILEEAAILFASGQGQVAEHMLLGAIKSNGLGKVEQVGWYMLFDLYQISNSASAFESLSIDYARKFERSPPNWRSSNDAVTEEPENQPGAKTITISFLSKLNADVTKLLDKVQTAANNNQQIRLDFSRVKELDAVGCGLLLRALLGLKKSGQTLTMIGAQGLADKIRGTIEVGRRDESEHAWLLLLEILQLLNLEESFEETSIDYCITFEVSPPSFETSKSNITMDVTEVKMDDEPVTDRFMMPKVIEGSTDNLTNQIADYARTHNPVVLDCAELDRVEFGASAQLLNGLVPIVSKKGTSIMFQDVNYPVLMLFNAMGLKSVATIFPRKH